MISLPVLLPNRKLEFTETGDVRDQKNGSSIGRWSAESSNDTEQNHLIFHDVAGARQVIKAHYTFNAGNQLVISLAANDGDVTKDSSATFNGYINIDDEHDVLYVLTDGPDTETGQTVVLYGDLAFDGPTKLALRLSGGGQTAIVSQETTPLSADQNTDIALAGRDLLVFKTSTSNTFGTAQVDHPATISFAGQWKLLPQGISFECSASGDLTNPDLVLSLKGRCKAVAAGLEFRLNNGAVQALFTVEGRHTYDAGTATWSLAVGYNQLAEPSQRIKAMAKGAITHKSAGGNTLSIEGTLAYQGGGQGGGTLDLAIAAEYTFAGGKVVFKATAAFGNSQLQYDLQLGGEIKVGKNGKLAFDVKYGSNNIASIEVKYSGSDSDFLKNFNVKITRDASGKVKAAIQFTIKVTYINGVQIAQKA